MTDDCPVLANNSSSSVHDHQAGAMGIASVLAAVGQFPQDDAVLARALEITTAHRAALVIVHVIDIPCRDGDVSCSETLFRQAVLAARDGIDAALDRLGADASDPGIRIETGSPALRLIDICNELEPGLVVMRAHQNSSIADKILGSTTDRIIAAGNQPVLVVKHPVEAAYGRVLVATDGTDDARAALDFVGRLLPDAALHLAQVVQIVPQLKEAMLRSGTDQTEIQAHRNALARIARKRLTAVASSAASKVKTHVLRGKPATALIHASRTANVDLIAAGRGRSSLIRRVFVGSVTRRLLRDAACDVLICREGTSRD